ncbi:MAG: efflux RND transporter periplasmic adaptor subunit [Bacteroidales bacterium]|nr:efflux RND transporter periplasmic adaptor subunit [Bacteroidales bacterium]
MKKILFFALFLSVIGFGCDHEQSVAHDHEAEDAAADGGHDHGEVKFQMVSYSSDMELFAEADPFIVGQESNILAHFTFLEDFSPLDSGQVSLRLKVGSEQVKQTIDSPLRPGIYAFKITPTAAGPGTVIFDVQGRQGSHRIVTDVEVFADEHDAIHEAEKHLIDDPAAIVFTKEQSWKVDFSTVAVGPEEFGQVIKTTALVRPSQNDMVSIVARTSGIVDLSGDNVFEGTAVTAGKALFMISGDAFAGDNSYVRFIEAQNNFEEARANYERLQALAADRIVTEPELLESKREFETAKVIYESLRKNFDRGTQIVQSPVAGYVDRIYVRNGEYVEAGRKLVDVAQNKKFLLMADVQQKYAPLLGNIKTANIRVISEQKTWTLEELNGGLSSVGRSANSDNYLIPVRFEIENTIDLLAGTFVELYIICGSDDKVLTVPNEAILEEQGKYFVMVQLTPEQFLKREVFPGPGDGKRSIITQGLEPAERIVARGAVLVKLSQAAGALDPHAGHVH